MKKSLIFLSVVAILLIAGLFCFQHVKGWMEFRWNKDTPKEFLSHVSVSKQDYTKDSEEILKQLNVDLKHHIGFFYSKEYYDSTQLFIDTILYSPDFDKIAVFVLTKNPTSRQLLPDEKFDWYYNATCYLGIKKKDSLDLSCIGPSFTNSTNKKKLISAINDNYFRLFATIKDTSGQYQYKYNLNDLRFWSCPIWKEIALIKQQKKEFEKEKKNHPENVYEPKQ